MQVQPRPPPKAVIFDIGGVVAGSPLVGINTYERAHGLPHDYLNVGITARGPSGAFQRFERAELALLDFYDRFGKELSDVRFMNRAFEAFCKARKRGEWADEWDSGGVLVRLPALTPFCPFLLSPPSSAVPRLPAELRIDGRDLFGTMMRETARADLNVIEAIRRLKASNLFKLAALTNNFVLPTAPLPGSIDGRTSLEEELDHLGMREKKWEKELKELFDGFFESSVVGLRKPDAKFYLHACDAIGIRPDEAVFLDDIGHNLKAAQDLGMRTIRVSPTSSLPALRELEKMVGMSLVDGEGDGKENDVKTKRAAKL